jgi:hypothetical protein
MLTAAIAAKLDGTTKVLREIPALAHQALCGFGVAAALLLAAFRRSRCSAGLIRLQ